MLGRRAFLAAAGASLALAPGAALAALKMPLKEPPPRVRPLGTWKLAQSKLQVVRGETITVELYFRPALAVADAQARWWRGRTDPVWPPREIQLHDEPCLPPDCLEEPPFPMDAGAQVPVYIPITVPTSIRRGGYRFTCEMGDPESKRRSLFSFVVRVLDPS